MISKPVVFMFSGQGSQYYHMGKALFTQNQVFRKNLERLDAVAQDLIGESIIEMLYHEDNEISTPFDNIFYTSPAIVMVEYALAQFLIESGIEPDYVLGSSIGEFTAAAIAKMISIDKLMCFIFKYIKHFKEMTSKGRMIGVISDIKLYYNNPIIRDNSEIAAKNFDYHFVISCSEEKYTLIEDCLKSKKINYQMLPVDRPFHSSLMEPAELICKRGLREVAFSQPQIPFISSTYAKAVRSFHEYYLWDVLRKPIMFHATIQALEKTKSYHYIDLGPSGTLATFVKYILEEDSQSDCFPILTPFGQDLKNINVVKKAVSRKKQLPKEKMDKMEDKKMLAFLFPGQGSQKKGMGEDLFNDYQAQISRADEILGYSIKDLCLNDLQHQLGQTQYTQPAIYVVSALAFMKAIEESNQKPDFVAGHSLGEYTALFAAGAFDFETGLKLVKKRGELMGQVSGGGMAAVIGLDANQINEVLKENKLSDVVISNYNTPSQIVISGPRTDIDRAKPLFEKCKGVLYFPLNVSGAFHSQFMEPVKQEFSKYIKTFEIIGPTTPIVSNVTARFYTSENVEENIIQQLTSSVQWTDSIRYLMGKGDVRFKEIGPGNVLTGMVKKIQKEAEPIFEEETEKRGRVLQESKMSCRSIDQSPAPETDTNREAIMKKKAETTQDKQINGEQKDSVITAATLGNKAFKKAYNLKYPYATGGMYHGIASKELVEKICKAGMLGFFGSGALPIQEIEKAIQYLKEALNGGQSFGMNLLRSPLEEQTIDLFLKYNVNIIEAAAYMQITPSLVQYRLKGISSSENGSVSIPNRILAKVSRPEVAELFLRPAPDKIVEKLHAEGVITIDEVNLSKQIPMADDLIVEADSGGHTDQGVAYTLMPAMIKLRDEMMEKYQYPDKIRIGAAGGIGTPDAAAAAFILGADFVLTGSINQCTVEAGTSELVKDLLQNINVQDTDYAPAGDMFEFGAKVQVLRKGVFFPARANKLYNLYQMKNSLDDIDERTQKQLQEKYFQKSFVEIFEECKLFYPPTIIEKAEKDPKQKMALIFKWYFGMSSQFALDGNEKRKVDCQIQCGPALGAFNQWVKGTSLENWKNRHVDEIGIKLMNDTAEILNRRFHSLSN